MKQEQVEMIDLESKNFAMDMDEDKHEPHKCRKLLGITHYNIKNGVNFDEKGTKKYGSKVGSCFSFTLVISLIGLMVNATN